MNNIKLVLLASFVLLVLAVLLAGCASVTAKTKGDGKSRSLSLFAFNYTDRGFLEITVDGMWMGGVDAYVNGGSAIGPRPPRDRSKQHTVEVKWVISASYYDLGANKYIKDGEVVTRQVAVPIKFPYPDDPGDLILHFYPDGRVEAEMIDRKDNKFDFRRIPIPEGHKYNGAEG